MPDYHHDNFCIPPDALLHVTPPSAKRKAFAIIFSPHGTPESPDTFTGDIHTRFPTYRSLPLFSPLQRAHLVWGVATFLSYPLWDQQCGSRSTVASTPTTILRSVEVTRAAAST